MGGGISKSKKKADALLASKTGGGGSGKAVAGEKGESRADEKEADKPVDATAGAGEGGMPAVDDEESEAIEGVDDLICRLAQAHPTQTPKRWELITRKLNRAMKKQKIPAQPMKALFAREGLCIPQSWIAEKAQAERDRALALAKEPEVEEHSESKFGKSLFRKKNAANTVSDGKNQQVSGENDDIGVNADDEAGESDTESESDDENSTNADDLRKAGDGEEPEFKYEALSKYEVFSLMRGVHGRAGDRAVEAEDAIEEIESAKEMVDTLYEGLPTQTLKQMSQENRMKAGLRQDSLVYGELDVIHFLKVMVKLKRIHGHMVSFGGSFWDLGAGGGKLVIAAAMIHNFETSYGIECLEDLRKASRPVLDRWRKDKAPNISEAKVKIRVDFIFADVLKQAGWVEEATVLVVHANFSAKNHIELRKKADEMQVGAICLSVSVAAVGDDKWGLLAEEKIQTSWGSTKLFIHEKLAA